MKIHLCKDSMQKIAQRFKKTKQKTLWNHNQMFLGCHGPLNM